MFEIEGSTESAGVVEPQSDGAKKPLPPGATQQTPKSKPESSGRKAPLREIDAFGWLRNLRPAVNVLIVGAVVLLGLSYWRKGELPDQREVLPELLREPVQTSTESPAFKFIYAGISYEVEPLADYDLAGMVVSHNNPTGIADIYHDSRSVDIRDLCVVWGQNFSQNVHQRVKFWSEPWTCYYQTFGADQELFQPDQLSNNHLLSSNPGVRAKILSANPGDQLRIRGRLVRYFQSGQPDIARTSSLVRTDTGNGACEVLFADEVMILRRANPGWQRLWSVSESLLAFLLIARLALFLFLPLRYYQ